MAFLIFPCNFVCAIERPTVFYLISDFLLPLGFFTFSIDFIMNYEYKNENRGVQAAVR